MGRDESNEAGMFWWRWSLFTFRGVCVDGGAWLMTMLQLETPGSKTVPVQRQRCPGLEIRNSLFRVRGRNAQRSLGLLLCQLSRLPLAGMR
jgi:hypothetical protein